MTISILKAESFQPLGPAIKRTSKPAPDPVQVRPGVFQGTDGRMFTDFATGQSVAPAPKAAPETPLPVVPNALGDGWIAHTAGPCPIPFAKGGEYEIRWDNGAVDRYHHLDATEACGWDGGIVAFRLIPTEAA